jgi:hypothetical protein
MIVGIDRCIVVTGVQEGCAFAGPDFGIVRFEGERRIECHVRILKPFERNQRPGPEVCRFVIVRELGKGHPQDILCLFVPVQAHKRLSFRKQDLAVAGFFSEGNIEEVDCLFVLIQPVICFAFGEEQVDIVGLDLPGLLESRDCLVVFFKPDRGKAPVEPCIEVVLFFGYHMVEGSNRIGVLPETFERDAEVIRSIAECPVEFEDPAEFFHRFLALPEF